MKMFKVLSIFLFLLGGGYLHAQTAVIPVYACNNPGVKAITSGSNSSNYLQGAIPSCTVTVFLTGTTTKATIYKDSSNTPQNNPFTANTNSTIQPIYASINQGYDVVLSGGIPPNTYPIPLTLTDVFPGTNITVNGGINQLTGDVLAGPGNGSQAATTVGIQGHALPTLTTGYLNWTGSAWAYSSPSTGTVTSVGLSLPSSVFNTCSGPITTSGTITCTFVNQTANTAFLGPASGAPGSPSFRALVVADIPNLGSLYVQYNPSAAQTVTQAVNTNFGVTTSGTGAINLTSANTETLSATNGVTINGVQFSQSNGIYMPITNVAGTVLQRIGNTPFLYFAPDADGTDEDTILLAGNGNNGSTDTTSNFILQAPKEVCIQGGQPQGVPTSPNVSTCQLSLSGSGAVLKAPNGATALTIQSAAFSQGAGRDIFNVYTALDATPASTKVFAIGNAAGGLSSGITYIWSPTLGALSRACSVGDPCSSSSGGVTSVATTGPITGGTITTTGTIACPTCVISASSLTANQLLVGGGSQATATLGSLGTVNQVLHGNASGLPTWGAVSLSGDVTGNLPFSSLTTLSANQLLGALTTTTPSGLSVPSCSGGTNALIWTSGTGFGCNTITPGTGTVTSVGLAMPGVLFNSVVSGSPVTTSGTFAPALIAQAANTFFGNCTGSSATPTFCTASAALASLGAAPATGSGNYVPTNPTGNAYTNILSGYIFCFGQITSGVCNGTSVNYGGTINQTATYSTLPNGWYSPSVFANTTTMQPPNVPTSSLNYSSPFEYKQALFWNGTGAGVSQFLFQNYVPSTGTNPASTYVLTYQVTSGSSTPTIDLSGRGGGGTTDIPAILGKGSQVLNASGTATNPCLADGSGGGSCGSGSGSGISGATAGQALIAGSATTATSSKALAGSGAGLTTGPTTTVSGDVMTATGTAGQIADSGILGTNLVTAAATLTSNQLVLGAGTKTAATLGSLGTTTTVLHGNAAGAPSFSAVSLTADVTNTLPVANGGTGTGSTLIGLVRGNASAMTAAEISGDCTTSGSNAITCTKTSGTSFGTMATQNASAVAITGGTINSTNIGQTTPALGTFTTLTANTANSADGVQFGTGTPSSSDAATAVFGTGTYHIFEIGQTNGSYRSAFTFSAKRAGTQTSLFEIGSGYNVNNNDFYIYDAAMDKLEFVIAPTTGFVGIGGFVSGVYPQYQLDVLGQAHASGGFVNPTSTVSGLPSASASGAGAQYVVTDSLTYTGGACTGGGADTMIAVSNGSSWSCH